MSAAEISAALAHADWAWGYHHMMSRQAREEMDSLLVALKHPLAEQPGTNESRFRQLHAQGFRFL